jgi:hypothetical protein
MRASAEKHSGQTRHSHYSALKPLLEDAGSKSTDHSKTRTQQPELTTQLTTHSTAQQYNHDHNIGNVQKLSMEM